MNLNLKVLLVIIIVLLTACGGLSTEQKQETKEALKALGKINSAIEIGVNYENYNILVLEANAQVDEACAVLPEGPIIAELMKSVESFVDARAVWSYDISSGPDSFLRLDKAPGDILLPRYSFGSYVRSKVVLQKIWVEGTKHLEKAKELFVK